ncbi:MAG: hypothetical protein JNL10_09235 [Verrucomicrobiales bacterium]|nr:hypothetical protein [Verrucomicrobiales bacterium]
MAARIFLTLVTAFWLVMNVLLWRAEFGHGPDSLSEIPIETVLDRLLNAPDHSVLVVRHRGTPLGLLRWIPTVTETQPASEESVAPEGMVTATGYNLDVDLNLTGGVPSDRWRVLVHTELDTNRVWRELSIRFLQRPSAWEITARNGDDRIRVRFEEGKSSWEQVFTPRDLQQAGALLGPYAALLPGPLKSNLGDLDPALLRNAIRWEARNDWLKVGRNRVRVFRVHATVLGRYEGVVYLSRAGEVLQAKLPDNLLLSNEALPLLGNDAGPAPRP